ncbi:MAG: hypothetical protein AB7G17_06805 [Phycisphaerales bacterium]
MNRRKSRRACVAPIVALLLASLAGEADAVTPWHCTCDPVNLGYYNDGICWGECITPEGLLVPNQLKYCPPVPLCDPLPGSCCICCPEWWMAWFACVRRVHIDCEVIYMCAGVCCKDRLPTMTIVTDPYCGVSEYFLSCED